jgi:GDP-mannose 6-dehydrogenase
MNNKLSNISIFGLGYVGAVSTACLAEMGYSVIGVDIDQKKIELMNKGLSPIFEKDLPEMIKKYKDAGRLSVTSDAKSAVLNSELSIICVGTPSMEEGAVDLNFIRKVCGDIGEAIKCKNEFHVICIRSTLPSGTTRNVLVPIIEEHSCKKVGIDFGICFNPEFLRETTAVDDFFNPTRTVIGKYDERGAKCLESVYADIQAPIIQTSLEVAEMTKYVENSWHALKICFGNEIGSLCNQLGIDSLELMDIFCQDTKLNISTHYLKPGFSFGGSCLPKDVRAINHLSSRLKIETPLLASILTSNMNHFDRAIQCIRSFKKKKLGFLGLTFKPNTDDVRESPYLNLVEIFLKEGFDIAAYDANIACSEIMGENKKFLFSGLNANSNIIRENIDDVIIHAEVLVIAHNSPTYRDAVFRKRKEQIILDLACMDIKSCNIENYYTLI